MENKTTLIEVTEEELGHLINDLIAYCWGLEDKGLNIDDTYGYISRKNLCNKLKQIEKEAFPHWDCAG